jgi:very-short-patch-repair endonuclease
MPTAEALRKIRRATRHHGITATEGLDLSQRQKDECCKDGTLLRRYRGVFADPAVPRSRLQDLAAAVVVGRPFAAAWARSALTLWNVWDEHPAVPEVVVPYGKIRTIEGAAVYRSRGLDASMVTTRDHIRVVKPLVAIIGLGVVVDAQQVGDTIIRGGQRRLFTVGDVHAAIARYARPGRTGITVARQAVELIMIGDRPAESVLEFRFHIGPGRHGLPAYQYQHEVRIGSKKYRIDFAYPEVKLAVEVDGYETHSSPEALAADHVRANQLVLAGWTVLRFAWTHVLHDPAGVAGQILLKLGQLGYWD